MQLDVGSAVDRYVVEGLIGQGGVASVYRVRHSGLGTVHALMLADGGSWDTVTEELLASTRPVPDRVEVLVDASEVLLGLGRADEALAILARAEALEAEDGTPLGVLMAMSQRTPIFHLKGQIEGVARNIDEQLQLVATSPEIPNPVRNRYAVYPSLGKGLLASRRGDRAGVERALERVREAEVVQDHVVEVLTRELAILDRDVEGIRGNATWYWTECDRHAGLALAFERADLPGPAIEEWQAVIDSPCRLHRPERANRARAAIALAERAREQGDDAAVDRWVAEAEGLWPDADPDLPAMMRLNALRESR